MLHIFQYNNASGQVELEKGQILLIREFAALMEGYWQDWQQVCQHPKMATLPIVADIQEAGGEGFLA